MLKIKDSVDLKELEKFRFKYYEKERCYYIDCYGASIAIRLDRKIDFEDEWWDDDFEQMDILYDLIKADLVEKVKE